MAVDPDADALGQQPSASGETAESLPEAASDAKFEVTASRHFPAWLAEQQVSLVFTTYQAGRVAFGKPLKPRIILDLQDTLKALKQPRGAARSRPPTGAPHPAFEARWP